MQQHQLLKKQEILNAEMVPTSSDDILKCVACSFRIIYLCNCFSFFLSSRVCVFTEDGKLYVWGGNGEGQLGMGDDSEVPVPKELDMDQPITCIACGYYHSALVTGKYDVFALFCCMSVRGKESFSVLWSEV